MRLRYGQIYIYIYIYLHLPFPLTSSTAPRPMYCSNNDGDDCTKVIFSYSSKLEFAFITAINAKDTGDKCEVGQEMHAIHYACIDVYSVTKVMLSQCYLCMQFVFRHKVRLFCVKIALDFTL